MSGPVATKPSDLELTQDSVMTEVGGDTSFDQTNGNKTATPNGQDNESDTVQQPVKARFFPLDFVLFVPIILFLREISRHKGNFGKRHSSNLIIDQ